MLHEGCIEEDFTGAMNQATCSCGWSGTLRDTHDEAMKDLLQDYGITGQ